MTDKKAVEILNLLREQYPDAGTRLKFASQFELLIAVVLSAQSTDNQVNQVTRTLFSKYNRPEDLADLDIELLEELIKGVGLYKNKARFIKALSQELVNRYNSKVPSDIGQLIKLPGVGRKTANVVLAVGFNKPGLGVDTHVNRVVNRLGLVKEKRADKIEVRLKNLLPEKLWSEAHHLFIAHGRQVCKARKPKCDSCVLTHYCPASPQKALQP
ncbi:MAG: endonuclease III [Syntrophomonadaceae bacterium]|jgi:endonuclease-3